MQAARYFSAVVLTGPRRAGKTMLLRRLFPKGLEVDFLVPTRAGAVALVECKAGRTVTPAMAAPMHRLAETMKRKRGKTTAVSMFLVHQAPRSGTPTQAVSPGVRALPWQKFLDEL